MIVDVQPQSRSQDSGLLGRANEGELGLGAVDLSVHGAETGAPSSGKGLATFCWPRGHQASHGIARATDASEMIGVVYHQLYWLVPKIIAHVVTSNVLTAGEIRSRRARSSDRTKVGGVPATKGPRAGTINSCALFRTERGRNCSLSTYARLSGRDTPAAGRGLDHPRLDRGLLHQDSLFISERSDGVASYLKRLMSVVGHIAGLKGCLMGEVPVALGPIFKEVNRVCQGDYLPNQSVPLLQIDGANEVCIHSYLTENVGDQQGWRRISTPAKNVFLRFFGFNTCRVKFLREAGR